MNLSPDFRPVVVSSSYAAMLESRLGLLRPRRDRTRCGGRPEVSFTLHRSAETGQWKRQQKA
jgi:hypothetical protein